MQYVKKLVILSGGGARGTLMIEKSGFNVKCKLNTFDLKPNENYRLAVISGEDMFVMKFDGKSRCVDFEIGEMNLNEVHAAVLSESVIMYGSNCAKKLSRDAIMSRVNKQSLKVKEDSFITFSGPRSSSDYFKKISPLDYDDFAIAEKNYYPAYLNFEAASTVTDDLNAQKTAHKESVAKEKKIDTRLARTPKRNTEKSEIAAQPKKEIKTTSEKVEEKKKKESATLNKKAMPYELEQRYLRLIGAVNNIPAEHEAVASGKEKSEKENETIRQPEQKITVAEKPEVIAMARRITLRDYRVEEPKKARRKATFFERSSTQIEKLMNSFERFTALERLIPGSKFVKINYDKKRYYIVGVIGKDYICYGVPSIYSDTPPEPFEGYARWLPFDADKPHGDGFWMMYQDGVSGETIKN